MEPHSLVMSAPRLTAHAASVTSSKFCDVCDGFLFLCLIIRPSIDENASWHQEISHQWVQWEECSPSTFSHESCTSGLFHFLGRSLEPHCVLDLVMFQPRRDNGTEVVADILCQRINCTSRCPNVMNVVLCLQLNLWGDSFIC